MGGSVRAVGLAGTLLAIGACSALLDLDGLATDAATAGSAGSMASSGGGGGDGGSGGGGGTAMGCSDANDCTASSECGAWSCVAGSCQVDSAPFGVMIAAQTIGDCKVVVCDGNGDTGVLDDDRDVPDDANECTSTTCTSGEPQTSNLRAGSPCGDNGSLSCDGNGACIGCLTAADCGAPSTCASWACNAGTCTSVAASDGTDCGECLACAAGSCANVPAGQDPNSQCSATIAESCNGGGQCQCMDGAQNLGEAGVDCGGPCPGCPPGSPCATGSQCASVFCVDGVCCTSACDGVCAKCDFMGKCGSSPMGADPSDECPGADFCNGFGECQCADGLQSVGEQGIDCGGICPPCPLTCNNGVTDGTETDVDCGGPSCPDCANGQACICHTDCASLACCDSLGPLKCVAVVSGLCPVCP